MTVPAVNERDQFMVVPQEGLLNGDNNENENDNENNKNKEKHMTRGDLYVRIQVDQLDRYKRTVKQLAQHISNND